jgi:hypothetical protein
MITLVQHQGYAKHTSRCGPRLKSKEGYIVFLGQQAEVQGDTRNSRNWQVGRDQSTHKQKCATFVGAWTTMKTNPEAPGESEWALIRGEKIPNLIWYCSQAHTGHQWNGRKEFLNWHPQSHRCTLRWDLGTLPSCSWSDKTLQAC